MDIPLGFVLGVMSSLVASWILLLREQAKSSIRFRAILTIIGKIKKQLELDGYTPDHIVTIDRNSGVAGSILAGHVGLRAVVSVTTVNRRLPDGSREIHLDEVSQRTLHLLSGRKVLVLICCNDSGTSLGYVTKYLRDLGEYAPSEIRTAAVYTSYSPAFMPTYKGAVVGRQTRVGMDRIITRLPWMTRGWQHVFGFERLEDHR